MFVKLQKAGAPGRGGSLSARWIDKRHRQLKKNEALIKALGLAHANPITRRSKIKFEKRYILSKAPWLFDRDYYLETYPDVRSYHAGALNHWMRHGAYEGRDPHPLFNVLTYTGRFTRFPKGVNPLVHFLMVGRRSDQSPSRWFRYDVYRDVNSDVAATNMDPFEHFVRFGIHENRKSCDEFDPGFYRRHYRDALSSSMPALLHFLQIGRAEGRTGMPRDVVEYTDDEMRTAPVSTREERDQLLASLLSIEGDQPAAPVVDIVIPVYRDFYLTLACLRSVLKARNATPIEIVVVDDCSPEPDISAALEALAAKNLVTLIRHDTNKGFVRSVNEGMQLHPDRDVVLLNSDVEVYGDWVDRLRRCAGAEADIATVCPLTNSGTICSYPHFCKDNSAPFDISAAELDAAARALHAGAYVPAPTGVGFCMYIKRAAIADIGPFDEVSFGTGYGEENDFCLRGQAKGWKDVILTDTFVHHRGSASFLGEKAERVANAMNVINSRYPGYNGRIQHYIGEDPALPYRAALDRERLRRLKRENNVLIVSHMRGGGTEQHVRERIAQYRDDGWSAFRLRADPVDRRRMRLFHADASALPNLDGFDLSSEAGLGALASLLAELGIGHVEIHHLGDMLAEAPLQMAALVDRLGVGYDVIVHDYLPICPRINLADAKGRYCEEPDAAGCAACLARDDSDWGAPPIEEWRGRYAVLFGGARQVLVPSEDVAQRLARYFPKLAMQVVPHETVRFGENQLSRTRSADRSVRIGTVGAISAIKGLNVILACARHAGQKRLPIEFAVVGYTSNDIVARSAGLRVTGAYTNAELGTELEKAGLDAIFLASTWPETFSYTLSYAIRAGLPIIAFDIGAIAERLRDIPDALLLPLDLASEPAELTRRILEWVEQRSPSVEALQERSLESHA